MAGDIVKQLRDTRYPGQLEMRCEAADEIERLREALNGAAVVTNTAGWLIKDKGTEIARLRKTLESAAGYLMNAKIDLDTGAPKRTAVRTIEGGLKMVNEAIASAQPGPELASQTRGTTT